MHPNKRLFFAGASLALIATLALGGCGYTPAPPTAEQKDAAVTAQMNAEATAETEVSDAGTVDDASVAAEVLVAETTGEVSE